LKEETAAMKCSSVSRHAAPLGAAALAALLLVVGPSRLLAQRGAAAPPAAAPTAQAAAPIDLTGTWEAIITEDWRWRMMTPAKGDYQSVTLNDAARKVADTWDPDKDTAAGQQCKAYGAPALMRIPGRIRISWRDPNTLQVETEAGTQTRLLRFDTAAVAYAAGPNVAFTSRLVPSVNPGPPSLQGYSVAGWLTARIPTAPGGGRGGRGPVSTTLKVVTTNLTPGYLRRNGVPYSAQTVNTEYFNVVEGPDKSTWLVIANFVEDPTYLNQPFATSAHFKKLGNDAPWKPEPCVSKF
jgi:hypothetical protein